MKNDANEQKILKIFLYQKQDAVKFKQTTCLRVRESIDNYGCDIILTFGSKFTSLLFVEVIIILGYIFRANKGLFINDIITRGARGKITNFLRDIYSQNVSEGCQGTFQHYVRGCSIRALCKVLHFYLVFLPPMHIYKLLLYKIV